MAQPTIGGLLLSRLRVALPDAAAAPVAAALSWLLARALFGPPQPLFAAIAAIVCLAPGLPNHGRQAVGLVLGVATGIAVGEAALLVPDTFPALRLSLATFVAIMVASAYGLLPVVPIQSGVSALLVLALGPETAGTVRLLDVACGTAVGLLFSQVLFTPDPVKQLREGERALLDAIGTAFAEAEGGARGRRPNPGAGGAEALLRRAWPPRRPRRRHRHSTEQRDVVPARATGQARPARRSRSVRASFRPSLCRRTFIRHCARHGDAAPPWPAA